MTERRLSPENPEMLLQEAIRQEFSRPVPEAYLPMIGDGSQFFIQPEIVFDGMNLGFLKEERKVKTAEELTQLAISVSDLSPQGIVFAEVIKDAEFLDLGCGLPEKSWQPRAFFHALGGKCYIGVDGYSLESYLKSRFAEKVPGYDPNKSPFPIKGKPYPLVNQIGNFYAETQGGRESVWMEDDMLGAVSKLSTPKKRVFHLSGIQPEPMFDYNEIIAYSRALWAEISRASIPGSAIIINDPEEGMLDNPDYLDEEIFTEEYERLIESLPADLQWEKIRSLTEDLFLTAVGFTRVILNPDEPQRDSFGYEIYVKK